MLILKQKGVFALIMGKQCTAALGIKHMEKKPNGSTEHDKSLKKRANLAPSPFVNCLGKFRNIDDFLAWKNIVFFLIFLHVSKFQ